MRFLIKLAFWFSLSLMMIAEDRGGLQFFADPTPLDGEAIEYVLKARELAGNITAFCAENPSACPDIAELSAIELPEFGDDEDSVAALIREAQAKGD